MTKKELQARWNAPITGADLQSSPFGKTQDGLEDFRGAYLSAMFKFEANKVDLSYTSLWTINADVGQISVGKIYNSKFFGVKYSGTLAPDNIDNCEFSKGIIDAAFLTGIWKDCLFDQMKFKKSRTSGRVVFERCQFSSCLMTHVLFMECTFKNCTFKNCKTGPWASFARSKFIGCDLSEMDFGEAILEDIVVEDCVLPAGGLPPREVAEQALSDKIDRMIEKNKLR